MTDALDWLLEEDPDQPGVRYLSLVDLLDRPVGSPEVETARRAVMETGPVPEVLATQDASGYWVEAGPGYYPKYRGTVWSICYLAQLGADGQDERIRTAGDYVLDHARSPAGVFSAGADAMGNIGCLNGNLGAALLDLGFGDDPRLRHALEMMARYVTGEGIAPQTEKTHPRYLKSATCAPGFCCSANNSQPCAWGAVKLLRALARVPPTQRTPILQGALDTALEFLFSVDPATAGYPAGYSDKPSRSWFQFGFPVFYVTDVLQIAEALTDAGCAGDPRLKATYELIESKRDDAGRWRMEYSYAGKTWIDAETKRQPSKWVTLRALRVLKGRDAAA